MVSAFFIRRRLGFLRWALILIVTSLSSMSHANAPSPGTVCRANAEDSLEPIADFHALSSALLSAARGTPSLYFDTSLLNDLAQSYVSKRRGHMLIVFSWDENDMCLLLWRAGQGRPQYIRHAGGRSRLEAAMRSFHPQNNFAVSTAKRQAQAKRAAGAETEEDVAPAPEFDQEDTLNTLSELVFPPAADFANGLPVEITLMPVGKLATVPLLALTPFGREGVAADYFSINILPSIGDLATPPLRYVPGFKSALILANGTPTDPDYVFNPIPGTLREADFIAARFSGIKRGGMQATKEVYFEFAPTADLIALPTHGVADPNDPLAGGFLALGDGRLTAKEIQNHSLRAFPLVVLSACQSGLGQALDAGIIGVARAFQIAGASNTVMSLWDVNDTSAALLMEQFYVQLETYPPAEALRRAALATRQSYPDLQDWAAFTIFGSAVVAQ